MALLRSAYDSLEIVHRSAHRSTSSIPTVYNAVNGNKSPNEGEYAIVPDAELEYDKLHETEYRGGLSRGELQGSDINMASIAQEPAYIWLIEVLRREVSADYPESDVMGAVRREFLRHLAPVPGEFEVSLAKWYSVAISADWDLLLFLSEQEYPESASEAIQSAIVVTGSPTNAQALTSIEYMKQTWPTTGTQLLSLVQAAVTTPGAHECEELFPVPLILC